MALVSTKDMLAAAREGRYAVGHFNLNNLEFTQAVLQAAEEEGAPVILGVSEPAAQYMGGFPVVSAMVRALYEQYAVTVPVALHLDHGSSLARCVEAIHAGFTSVMIDGSRHPLEENMALTRRVVDVAHALGVTVEAELGHIGRNGEQPAVALPEEALATPAECLELARETGIDSLAPALGSVHGLYKGAAHLDFARMQAIAEFTGLPLVLHGGTGIPAPDVQQAIQFGTAKINVNTENQGAFAECLRGILTADPQVWDWRKYLAPAREAIKETVRRKIREFGSAGKA